MPSPARNDINGKILPRFSDICIGKNVLFVGSTESWEFLYRKMFNMITLDIDASKNPDVVGNIEATEYPDKSWDALIMIGVYEYLNNTEAAFKEINRILKDDGVALICLPGRAFHTTRKRDVEPESVFSVVKPLRVRSLDITYYKSAPYYLHIICERTK